MTGMLILALLLGVVAGSRTFTAPAAVAWAAATGRVALADTPLAFLDSPVAAWVLTGLAALELVGDKLPKTPSRKAPGPFVARLISGAFCGAAIGWSADQGVAGAIAGGAGATLGTLGGYAARMRLARRFGRDLPAAVLEDVVAVGGAALLLLAL
ncbi:DUF4126 family protein [Phenylobacterium sp.]|uniref:DUF4126 family protein n=1 Tax=Phenylobacterium sp. TaxID=1871053 RepID=UPI002C65A3F4|nr:DUF4126 family protein [Phenylobacterium sp.]HVI33831.1 DUF4126 family protein [Phenylobacterium sp.]